MHGKARVAGFSNVQQLSVLYEAKPPSNLAFEASISACAASIFACDLVISSSWRFCASLAAMSKPLARLLLIVAKVTLLFTTSVTALCCSCSRSETSILYPGRALACHPFSIIFLSPFLDYVVEDRQCTEGRVGQAQGNNHLEPCKSTI